MQLPGVLCVYLFTHVFAFVALGAAVSAGASPFPQRAEEEARKELDVLEGSANLLLHSYLMDVAKAQFDARKRALEEAEASPGMMGLRIGGLREAYRSILGPFPDKTPLNAMNTGTIRCSGFCIEKIVFESRPCHHVTANCYVPEKGTGPYPAVLVMCGHSAEGKAFETYQHVCILLAANGFIALIVDPISQGERYQFLDADGKPATRGGTTDHSILDVGAKLAGTCVAAYEAWDNIRGIDYLVSRPDVDSGRIGCTGNSGGGTQTTFLIPLDERIRAAAPSCFVMTRERLFETIGPQDGCQHMAGEGALGIEHADYLTMFAPRPVRILAAEQDFFDFDATKQAFKEAKRAFSALGVPDKVDLFSYDDTHGFSRPRRMAAVQWMKRWLMNDSGAVLEARAETQKEEDLLVAETGQVMSSWENEKNVADMNLELANALAEMRGSFWRDHDKTECLAEAARLANIRLPVDEPEIKQTGTIERESCRIEKLVLTRPGEVPVPGLLFVPRRTYGNKDKDTKRLPAVLYVDGRGKSASAHPGGALDTLAAEGRIVLSIDLRGFGETEDDHTKNLSKHRNREHRCAVLSIHIGRPLLGQRTEDILAAFQALRSREDVDPDSISLVGCGRAGPPALHAAALEPCIAKVTVKDSISSWIDVVASPLAHDMVTHVVPFALTRYDLPDLERAIAPRPVVIFDPVDLSEM